jgi:hypothetical protein
MYVARDVWAGKLVSQLGSETVISEDLAESGKVWRQSVSAPDI